MKKEKHTCQLENMTGQGFDIVLTTQRDTLISENTTRGIIYDRCLVLHFYLLRLDWNLILRSRCAEYEIRRLQEPTCSGSKYLEIKAITTVNDQSQEERRRCKSKSCLGMLLPSSAFLAEEAVSASVN